MASISPDIDINQLAFLENKIKQLIAELNTLSNFLSSEIQDEFDIA